MAVTEVDVLQSVSFRVAGVDVRGVLHLPQGEALGGAVVLHPIKGHPDQADVVTVCEALADAGIGAIRFAYRQDAPSRTSFESALGDVGGAVRLVKAHPALPERLGVVGFSSGAAVAAVAAGRDSRMRAAVLVGPPVTFGDDVRWKPIAELSRTRARVLLVRGSLDDEVSDSDLQRYATVLTQARVANRTVTIDGADQRFESPASRAELAEVAAAWLQESL